MQQTLNSYNLYKIPSTSPDINLAGNNQAQFVIGSGVFSLKGSCVTIEYLGVTGAATTARFYGRTDCVVFGQAPTIVTIDGVQRAQYLNLTAAQIATTQDLPDLRGRYLDQVGSASAQVCNTLKKFEPLGCGADATGAQSYFQSFPLQQFFPGCFNEQDEFFVVNSVGNITMNCAMSSIANSLYYVIAQQAAATANVGTSSVLSALTACTGIRISLNLKRVTNHVEQAQASVSPHVTCYLQQAQPLGTGVTFNQSFGGNQISTKQDMAILPIVSATIGTVFNLDEIPQSAAANVINIQRCGVNIVSANSTQEAIRQLQLAKEPHKPIYNDMVFVFHTVFSNANVQTQFSLGTSISSTAYMGYSYMQQVM